jgi:hypothetical protein
MSVIWIDSGRFAVASAYDTDAQNYITAVEAADGQALEAATRDAINAFVVGCKADGIWSAIKASCVLAGARTLTGALVPLAGANPTNVNFVSGDYNRKTGLLGSATKYLDTNRSLQADPQDSFHQSVYVSTIAGVPSDYCGNYSNSPASGNLIQEASGFHAGYARSSSPVNANNRSTGFVGIIRSSSTAMELRSGSAVFRATATSVAPPNATTAIFTRSDYLVGNASRLAFYSIGESLSLALLDARVTALVTAIDSAF